MNHKSLYILPLLLFAICIAHGSQTVFAEDKPCHLSKEHLKALNRPRRIILHHDPGITYYRPDRDLQKSVNKAFAYDKLPNSQIDTVFVDVGGDAAYWPSKTIDQLPWLKEWFAEGNDMFPVIVKKVQDSGREIFWSFRINGIENVPEPIKEKYADWLIDWKESPCWRNDGSKLLWDFSHDGVHDLHLKVVEELVGNYRVDGIQFDFARHTPYLPIGHQWENRAQLSKFMRRVRELLIRIENKQNRTILFSVRIPDSLVGCRFDGIDIKHWVDNRLVDILVLGGRSFDIRVGDFRSLTQGSDIKIFPNLDMHHASDGYSYAPMEYYRGVASEWQRQKADGIVLFNFRGGSFLRDKDTLDTLAFNQLGSPETLRGRDKTCVVQRRAGGAPWKFGHAEEGKFQCWGYVNTNKLAPLPCKLGANGKALSYLRINVGDDPNASEQADSRRLATPKLRILLSDPSTGSTPQEEKIPVGGTKYRYGWNLGGWGNFQASPLLKADVKQFEVRLNNTKLGPPRVAKDGYLEWDVRKNTLGQGENLITVRTIDIPREKAEQITIECVELE